MVGPRGGTVAAVVMASIGILLWGGGLWILLEQQRELWRFEATTGEIVTAAVTADDTPRVKYEYEVDGEPRTGDTVWPAGMEPFGERVLRGNAAFARQVVSQYVVGDAVTVYYDPERPGTTFLRRDRNVVGAMALLVAGTLPIAYATPVLV